MACSLTYANSTALNITNGLLPQNFCHTTWQNTLDNFTSTLSVSMTGNTSTFTFGPTTPPAENRDRPWLKVNTTTCKAEGWYFFNSDLQAWEPVLVQDVDALLADTGVVAGTYPLATVTVNSKGRLTSATAGNASSIAKAWVTFTGATGVALRSFGIQGVTRTGTGSYTVDFSSPLSGNQTVITASSGVDGFTDRANAIRVLTRTTNQITLSMPVSYHAGTAGDGDDYWAWTVQDPVSCYVAVFD